MSGVDRASAPETHLPNVVAAKLGLRIYVIKPHGTNAPGARISAAPDAEIIDRLQTEGVGLLPKRVNTVRASVLARMLRGEQLTAMDGVLDASTTRLASDVHVLRRKLGWAVITDEVQVSTADGRIADVARYSLSAEVIAAALAAGAEAFIAAAMAASAERHTRSSGRVAAGRYRE